MTKSVNKRLVILLTVLVIACGGLFALNGTFAGRVTYDNEQVVLTGENFNVNLEYLNGGSYVSLFSGNAQPFPENSKWCPGRSEIVYLKLSNAEAFPVDCSLSLKVKDSGFDDVISYAVIAKELVPGSEAHPTSWEDFVSKAANGAAVLADGTHQLTERQTLMPGDERFLALCMHMSEEATSQYQNKQMNLQFALRTNANYEPGAIPGI